MNEGKHTDKYKDETNCVTMNPDDMERLGLSKGDRVRLTTGQGSIIVLCTSAKADAMPPGLLFMAYGPPTSQLMQGDTQGTGMPDSKGLDVELERAK